MASKYPRSLRCCLPLWAFTLQVAFILLLCFLISSDIPQMQQKFMVTYQVIPDLTLMAALGFGFLSSSFRRHSWSSVAFNLFVLTLGVQWSILLDRFLNHSFIQEVTMSLSSIQTGTMSTVPVLISAVAVLGKANLVQLAVMVLMEASAFGVTRLVIKNTFHVDGHIFTMYGHVFGAYFGLLVAWCLSRSLPRGLDEEAQTEKVQMATSSSLFAMLGTLLLWIFWPSFNSVLVEVPNDKRKAVLNTYYALAVSAVTATSMSALSHPQGKINMVHLHNAVLAGGVAVGAPCLLITSPWVAMVLGLTAGLISIGGAKCLPVCLNHILQIQNPGGIHYTFGLPGLLGAVTYILMNKYGIFELPSQLINDFGALSFVLAMGMASGLLTGCLLTAKVWRAPHTSKYFDDQAFWEFPHLAVGF
ncbi:blood group Rh(CE) polypeptide [Mesocricetus auratus]|uniref:Blood group Rh(CE) polypeptide n=1 Tax=Mesocricetus auratus TaxID=10036 RepID=A0ABM2YBW6_MESAU|nr:blood group Rh(CE) polypeptide [Mesocricetus auratus]